jgi:AdoMet-dependent heme synthase
MSQTHSPQPEIVKPRVIAFEVTRRCPLHCRHCRAAATAQGQDPLSTEQCKAILKGVAAFTRCVMILTGGEPMERPDVYELIEESRALGLRPVMATCGLHINDESIQRLRQAGLLALSFSLDGATPETHDAFRGRDGAFRAVEHAIACARRAGVSFQINTTITRLNVDELPSIARQAVDFGATCFNPFILVPVGRGRELEDLILSPDVYERVLHDLARLKVTLPIDVRVTCGPQFARVARQEKIPGADRVPGCLAATEFAFISHSGEVQTCGFLEISAGNLIEYNYDFGAIWTGSDYLQSLRDLSRYQGACKTCPYLSVCRGCRARAFAMRGDVLAADPICVLTRRSEGT